MGGRGGQGGQENKVPSVRSRMPGQPVRHGWWLPWLLVVKLRADNEAASERDVGLGVGLHKKRLLKICWG